jgi:hypothetical protein
MRYKARAVFNSAGVVGFAIETSQGVMMRYTVPRPDLIELHRTPNDQPSAASLEALREEDFPEYIRGLFGSLRFGEIFITDDLPTHFIDRQERIRFSDWLRAKAKELNDAR